MASRGEIADCKQVTSPSSSKHVGEITRHARMQCLVRLLEATVETWQCNMAAFI